MIIMRIPRVTYNPNPLFIRTRFLLFFSFSGSNDEIDRFVLIYFLLPEFYSFTLLGIKHNVFFRTLR